MKSVWAFGCIVFALVCTVTLFVKYGLWALLLALLLASFYSAFLVLMFTEEE